jgi:hypothetical protein
MARREPASEGPRHRPPEHPRQELPEGRRQRLPPLVAHATLVAASLIALALALVSAELVLRLSEPGYLVRTRGLHVYSRERGWTGRAGAVTPMGRGQATLDEHGFRGATLPRAKVGGRTRVLVLGDSVAFGYGVADGEEFPRLLDAALDSVEVANLAVQGYGPGQELLVLRREGLALEPDVVLLAFCLRNDFVDAVLPVALYDGVTPRPVFRLDGASLVLDDSKLRRSAVGRLATWLADHSHLFNRAASLLPARDREAEGDWRSRKQEALRDPEAALAVSVALVLEMDRLCRERGVPFLVVTFPNGLSFEMETGLAAAFERRLADAGIRTVDMAERFRAHGATPDQLSLDRTGHLAARGHALAAQILASEIAALAR